METKNAIITRTRLEIEDHGILTAWLMLDYGGSSQGFGGYALDSAKVASSACGVWVRKCLEVVGSDSWEALAGKPVRVRIEAGRIREIGHFVRDVWFEPGTDLEAAR